MTSKEKYEKLINTYKKSTEKDPFGFHTHHIYPKSIWPEAKDEPDNLVELPPIMHWYAHKLLNEAFIELNMHEYANKLSGCCSGIAQFINKDKPKLKTIDFSKEKDIIEFLDEAIDRAAALHDMFVERRNGLINNWKYTSFVCIMGKSKDLFSVKVKKENECCMRKSELMSMEYAKAIAAEMGVQLTRTLTDKFAEKYGISDLDSVRGLFYKFMEYEQLALYNRSKDLKEPLAYDITKDVVEEFSFKTAMPNIFDIDTTNSDMTSEEDYE